MDNIISLSEQLKKKTEETKELIRQQNFPDVEVDAVGKIEQPALPPVLLNARLKLIRKCISINERVLNATMQACEAFILDLANGERDVDKAWKKAMEILQTIDCRIDWQTIFEGQQGPGLAVPKCQAYGKVVKNNDLQ